jgi:hypothetical protein
MDALGHTHMTTDCEIEILLRRTTQGSDESLSQVSDLFSPSTLPPAGTWRRERHVLTESDSRPSKGYAS